jgi:hypothetical protein
VCIAYSIIAATGRLDVTTRVWRVKTATDKTCAIFQTHFKAAYSDNRLAETTGTSGYHGAANLDMTLATTHSAFVVSEPALALILVLQSSVTPSVASTSDLLAITPITGAPSACSYCWAHGVTTNLSHTSAIRNHKDTCHQVAAT